MTAISAILLISTTATIAAESPYDLIRPTWPLYWDATVFNQFDTSGAKINGLFPIEKIPASYKAGELILDTLDQAYLDAINTKISSIRVNQAGYLKKDSERQFYYVGSAKEFEIVDAYGKSLSPKVIGTFSASGASTKSDWTIIAGTNAMTNNQKRYEAKSTGPSGDILIGQIPISVPTEQRLRVKVGEEFSSSFIVSEDVYTMVKDAAIKFLGIQRSGNSESWFHGPSHVKDGAGIVVNNIGAQSNAISPKAGNLQGGWYDSGNHLKESLTQSFAFMSLAVMSATNPTKDVDHYAYNHGNFVKTDGIPDMLREAKHGADFFLRAYRVANGVIDNMAVSIGNYGSDHAFWNRPEIQDYVTNNNRGGPAERDVRLGELGSNVSGEIAAGLAILSKNYAEYDKDFADSCLMVAEKMYDFAKSLAQGKISYDGGKTFVNNTKPAGWSTPTYNGNYDFFDDLAIAAVCLLYATADPAYLDDAAESKTLNPIIQQEFGSGAGFFNGGWFVTESKGFLKNVKNTSWDNAYTYALYAFYKLILQTPEQATLYGINETKRLEYIEDVIANMIYNVSDMSSGGLTSMLLPSGSIGSKSTTVSFDPIWFTMFTDQTWNYNRYQMGNIFEVLAYADVAFNLEKQGIQLPNISSPDWKADEMFQLGVNQLNYMLGVNPWDVSFIYGIGDKNDNHPHHRASNPEGRNTAFLEYKYVPPVGALYGGITPDNNNSIVPSSMSWIDYMQSEVSLDASAVLLSALSIVSNGGSSYYEKTCDHCNTEDPTPLPENGAYASVYRFDFSGIDYMRLKVQNTSMTRLDSVVAYLYFEASEEAINQCNISFGIDICQTVDFSGYNNPCSNEELIRGNLLPEKVDDSYNIDNKTYTWALPIVIDSLSLGSSISLDIGATSGIKMDNKCVSLNHPTEADISQSWSLREHSITDKEPIYYAGAPSWNKDELTPAPKAPYIVIRSKANLLWGYGPYKTTDDRVGFFHTPIVSKAMIQVNNNRLFVEAEANGSKTVKIFDLLGNDLLSKTFEGSSTEINLAPLAHRGTLVARLMTNGKLTATKAFKSR